MNRIIISSGNMGLLITLRRDNTRSYFRENLLALTSLHGDTLFLASGYFQEIITKKNGSTSNYSVLDDDLLTKINSNKEIKTIFVSGCMNSSSKNFQAFLKKLRKNWNGCLMVGTPKKNSTRWHAKIALILRNNETDNVILSVIVGSSNLTGPAYSLNGFWNHECDVTIWDNDHVKDANEVFGFHKMDKENYIFFERITDGDNEKNRMKKFLSEIKKSIEFTEYKKEDNK